MGGEGSSVNVLSIVLIMVATCPEIPGNTGNVSCKAVVSKLTKKSWILSSKVIFCETVANFMFGASLVFSSTMPACLSTC